MAEQTSPDRTDGNITLDAQDDRWEWRRKIRSDPKKHLIYRIGVGIVGVGAGDLISEAVVE